jgi:hypothetical protein
MFFSALLELVGALLMVVSALLLLGDAFLILASAVLSNLGRIHFTKSRDLHLSQTSWASIIRKGSVRKSAIARLFSSSHKTICNNFNGKGDDNSARS